MRNPINTLPQALGTLLLIAVIVVACGKLLTTLSVVSGIALDAAAVLDATNPDAAKEMRVASADLTEVSNIVRDIEAAKTAADKQPLAVKLQATVAAATNHLTTVLSMTGLKSPKLLTEIRVAVGIVNAALTEISNHYAGIAPPQQLHSLIAGQPLPKSKGRSASDFQKEWDRRPRSQP